MLTVPLKTLLFLFLIIFTAVFQVTASHSNGASSDRHSITGVILEVKEQPRTVLLKHEAVERFLDSGETLFAISRGDASLMQEGKTIRGKTYRSGERYYLEKVYPVDPIAEKIMNELNRRLRLDTRLRGRKVIRKIGEPAPPLALYNQDGTIIRLDLLKGKNTFIHSIFTRCQVREMCPATTQKMAQLQARAKEQNIDDLHLILISFDPEYDSPGILKEYAAAYGIDNSNFDLLTGDPDTIDAAMRQFGIIRIREDGTINHTMTALLINKNGKIAYRKEGPSWEVNEVLEKLKEL